MTRRAALALLALAATGCHAVLNYPSPLGPRFARLPASPPAADPARALRVVTYNVQWGRHVDRAIHVLTTRLPLSDADIVVLQEMDADGTRRIASDHDPVWAVARLP